VAEDFFAHGALVYRGNDTQRMLTLRADQWISVPDLEDDVAPFLGGQFGGRRKSGFACAGFNPAGRERTAQRFNAQTS
jgi:hypothetical protein